MVDDGRCALHNVHAITLHTHNSIYCIYINIHTDLYTIYLLYLRWELNYVVLLCGTLECNFVNRHKAPTVHPNGHYKRSHTQAENVLVYRYIVIFSEIRIETQINIEFN